MKPILEGLRTLLILGRISNLPTVWSNLLAGWVLAGMAHTVATIPYLLLGGSFLYIGGMYLNDFCDAAFDARHCPERPIPAGKISRGAVGVIALFWFITGIVCLVPLGGITLGIGLLLLAAIVLYDFHHKNVVFAPLVMGGCRFLLYPLAASVAVTPAPLWLTVPAGVALGCYVAGITYLARGESRPARPARWALLLLLLPIAVSCGIYACWNSSHAPLFFTSVVLICLLQFYWMTWLLVPFWRKTNPSLGRVVSGLLAGIVLVDMIALVPSLGPYAVALFPLFILALLLQRVVPAT